MKQVAILAVLALGGCADISGGDGPRLDVAVSRQENTIPVMMAVKVSGRVTNVSAIAPGAGQVLSINAPRYGWVRVEVALSTPEGAFLGGMAFRHRLIRDHDHWVSAVVGRHRPSEENCAGTVAVTPLRLRTGQVSPDTLFVHYGGLPSDHVC